MMDGGEAEEDRTRITKTNFKGLANFAQIIGKDQTYFANSTVPSDCATPTQAVLPPAVTESSPTTPS